MAKSNVKTTKKSTAKKATAKTTKTTAKKSNLNAATQKKAAKKTTTPTKKTTTKTAAPKKPKNEFRKNKDTGHPSYIYQKVGRRYVYIGLTHSPITNDVKNIKLEQNPNPKDNKDAYFRPKAAEASANRFKKKEQGWKLTKADKKTADKIVAAKK